MPDDIDVSADSSGTEFNFDADFSTPAETGTPSEPPPGPSSLPGGGNPAWHEVLSIIPKEFHPQVQPHFQKWESGVTDRFSKVREEAVAPYAAFQRFVDEKVNPEELVAAHRVWQQINENPLAVYQQMEPLLRQMGLLEAPPANPDEEEGQQDEQQPVDPRLEMLEKNQQALIQSLMQQQQQEQLQAYAKKFDQQINDEFAQIEGKTGPMPEWLRVEVINRASMMTDQLGRPVSMIEAFNETQKLRQNMLSGRPGQQAPRVVPGGGGYPQPKPDPEKTKTFEGRAAAVAEIAQRFAQGQVG